MRANSIYFFCLLCVQILNCSYLIGQDDDYNYLPPEAPNPTFVSPEVASLGKYVDYPVGLYTGVPNINIPIYEINYGDIKLPISLSYHASGIKVEEIASWVGLGWSLNAGGVITRQVRGIPDDQYMREGFRSANGVPTDIPEAGYLYSGEEVEDYINGSHDFNRDEWFQFSRGGRDGEPDVFFYNFLGYTGKFIINHDQTMHLVKKQDNLVIAFDKEPLGKITSFTITTDQGLRLTFEDIEENITAIGREAPSLFGYHFNLDGLQDASISAWKLSAIESLNTGLSIALHYLPAEQYYLRKGSETLKSSENEHSFSNNAQFLVKRQLDYIQWGDNKVSFNAPLIREDVGHYNTYLPSYALTNILVQDYNQNAIIDFRLNYSYFFNETHDSNEDDYHLSYSKRLKLDEVYQIDENGKKHKNHSFSYNESYMPHRLSYEQDFWGYYNANYQQGTNPDKTMCPRYYLYPWDDPINDIYNEKYMGPTSVFKRSHEGQHELIEGYGNKVLAIRDANPSVMQACVLEKIKYPTGGEIEYIYEPNSFQFDNRKNIGGGLRVKKSVSRGFIDDSENLITEYLYENSDSTISYGRVIRIPQHIQVHLRYLESVFTNFSSSQGGLGLTHGSHIGYEQVTVKRSGNGKEVYVYSVPASFGDATAGCDGNECIYIRSEPELYEYGSSCDYIESGYPYGPDPNYDWARGLLKKKTIFDQSGSPVKMIEYDYKTIEYDDIPAMYCKVYCLDVWPSGNWDISCSNTKYYYLFAWHELESKKTTIYGENNENLVTETQYFFDNSAHRKTTRVERVNSKGEHEVLTYVYPDDITNPQEVETTQNIIDALLSYNMKSVLLKSEYKVDGVTTDGAITNYQISNAFRILPLTIHELIGNEYKKKVTIRKYTYESNAKEILDENTNIFTSYFWGYGGGYPVIEAYKCTFTELESAVLNLKPDFEEFLEGLGDLSLPQKRSEWRQFNNSLRNALPDATIKTYTYKPMVGMSSETGINSISTFYNFDQFGRLSTVRDDHYMILKHFEYNYKSDVENVNVEK